MGLTKLEKMELQAKNLRDKIVKERRISAQKNKATFDAKILAVVKGEFATYQSFDSPDFLNELRALFPPAILPQEEVKLVEVVEPEITI
jgi:hypothetical protein